MPEASGAALEADGFNGQPRVASCFSPAFVFVISFGRKNSPDLTDLWSTVNSTCKR